jgi:hypothetical protein
MKLFAPSIVVLALAAGGPAVAADRAVPVVVELFTSQGCSSCPPADAFLSELAKRSDVIALSLHVDYWDYIGWKDPFAQHAFTERQRAYSRALSQRYVYTPQMVVNGRLQSVGSDKREINGLITRAIKDHDVGAARRPTIRVMKGEVQVEGGPEAKAIIWLVTYDAQHRTAVARGENAGRDMANFNVVREWRPLGHYKGQPVALPLEIDPAMPTDRSCAVLVQQEIAAGPGPIVAALAIDMRAQR